MTWLYSIPTLLLGVIVVGLAVAVSVGAHAFVHRRIPVNELVKHNEVAGFIVAIVGVVYAVILGFVVIVVWEQYAHAESVAGREADSVADMYRLTDSLPSPLREHLKGDLNAYVAIMLEKEWPAMHAGSSSGENGQTLTHIAHDLGGFDPKTTRESNLQAQGLAVLASIEDARRDRLQEAGSGVPPILWATLLLGAAITVGFLFLFGMERQRVQLLMTGAVAAIIALTMLTIFELDYPFMGDVSIRPEMWEQLRLTFS